MGLGEAARVGVAVAVAVSPCVAVRLLEIVAVFAGEEEAEMGSDFVTRYVADLANEGEGVKLTCPDTVPVGMREVVAVMGSEWDVVVTSESVETGEMVRIEDADEVTVVVAGTLDVAMGCVSDKVNMRVCDGKAVTVIESVAVSVDVGVAVCDAVAVAVMDCDIDVIDVAVGDGKLDCVSVITIVFDKAAVEVDLCVVVPEGVRLTVEGIEVVPVGL